MLRCCSVRYLFFIHLVQCHCKTHSMTSLSNTFINFHHTSQHSTMREREEEREKTNKRKRERKRQETRTTEATITRVCSCILSVCGCVWNTVAQWESDHAVRWQVIVSDIYENDGGSERKKKEKVTDIERSWVSEWMTMHERVCMQRSVVPRSEWEEDGDGGREWLNHSPSTSQLQFIASHERIEVEVERGASKKWRSI